MLFIETQYFYFADFQLKLRLNFEDQFKLSSDLIIKDHRLDIFCNLHEFSGLSGLKLESHLKYI